MGWHFNDLTLRTSGPKAIFDLAAHAFFGQVTQHVFFQGFGGGAGDGRIHEFWWGGDERWKHNDLTGETDAPPVTDFPASYMFVAQGTQHVVYQGATDGVANGRIHELWWDDDDGWHHSDLTSKSHDAPLTISVPVGYEFFGQHVVYEGGDNMIHDLRWNEDGSWTHTNLTAVTGAPRALLSPTAYAFNGQQSQHVLYVGTDNHIHELWWIQQGPGSLRWHHNDLTNAARAPLAGGQPMGFGYDQEGTQHVFFRGTDGHIYELWWNNEGWHTRDLTGITGAPLATAGARPAGYPFVAQGTLHVDYLGVDGHIHEFWRDAGGWHHNDLTMAAGGAPPAISDPVGYVFTEPTRTTQHVIYVADSHDVIELWWSAN